MNHVVAESDSGVTTNKVEMWPECTSELCERINAARFFTIIAEPELAKTACAIVDRVCRTLAVSSDLHNTKETLLNDVDAKPTNTTTTTTTQDKVKPTDRLYRHELTALPRVCFTSKANQRMAQYCLAIHGRLPFFAFVDTCDEEDEHSFVLDLQQPQHDDKEGNRNGTSAIKAEETLESRVRAFLTRLLTGSEPRAMQGAAPPPGDLFLPTHGVILCAGRSAVTSSYERLKRGITTSNGGCVCVYWSDRCACCPGVLAEVELIVTLIRRVATILLKRHSKEEEASLFQFVACNIDDNDFHTRDWANGATKPTVPSITAFPASTHTDNNNSNTMNSTSGNGVTFTGERTALALVQFICTHCLPPATVMPQVKEIAAQAARIAVTRLGDVNVLMRTLDVKTNMTYQRAHERLAELMTQQRETDMAITAEQLDEVMRLFRQARRPLLDVEAIVQEECGSRTEETTHGQSNGAVKHTNGTHVTAEASVKRVRTEDNEDQTNRKSEENDKEEAEDGSEAKAEGLVKQGRAAAAQLSVNTTHVIGNTKAHEKRPRDAEY